MKNVVIIDSDEMDTIRSVSSRVRELGKALIRKYGTAETMDNTLVGDVYTISNEISVLDNLLDGY